MALKALDKEAFIEKAFYNVVKGKMSAYDVDDDGQHLPSVVILTGASGVGKSETALQLIESFKDENRPGEVIEWRFRSDSSQALLNDITTFGLQHDLKLTSLENIQQRGDLDTVFEELVKVLNERFPNHYKCLIFDDAERSTDVVRLINDWVCERVEGSNYEKWKMIVTTTDDDESGWLHGCDCISEQDFVKVEMFTLEETSRYLGRVKDLEDDHISLLHNKLAGLPVALKVAREYLTTSVRTDMSGSLEKFYNNLDHIDSQNKVNACFTFCIERLIDTLERPDLIRSLISMISLLDEKNITADIFTTLAEVVIANDRGTQRPQATVLSNKLLEGLQNRSLCEVMESPTGHVVVSLHKLVRQSASLLRQKDKPEDQRSIVRMCLVALTRIMPKDGRMHLSHIIYGYMYRHAYCISGSIRILKDQGIIERRESPEILLLYSSLLSSMAYCSLAQRIPLEEATPLLKEALDVYSGMLTGSRYNVLRFVINDVAGNDLDDIEKARLLLTEGRGEAGRPSPLMDNPHYKDIVSNLSPYLRLTLKDLKNMIDFEVVHGKEHYLQDGHIKKFYLNELKSRDMIIEAPKQERIYYIEILIEIYYVWVRIHSFAEGAALNRAKCCGQAALYLCEHVRNTHHTPLMTEVLINRSVLEIELKMGDSDVKRILQDYTALSEVGNDDSRRYGYEYGVRRTDFSKDDYHRLLCKEGKATCFGKLCEQAQQQNLHIDAENYFMKGDAIFKTLTQENQPSPNFQTLSKSYKRYSSFLAQCDKLDEAVRILLDAMYFLHIHLKQRASDGTEHPEQNNCGKFTDLYGNLGKLYNAWAGANPDRHTMLLTDNNDQRRNDYVSSFNKYYADTDALGKYPIMWKLLPANYADGDNRSSTTLDH